jgi:phospholipase/carboxylesterase
MINKQPLTCIEINPRETTKRSVIWLHGLGADGNDFVPLVPELHLPDTLGVRFVFPHAPIMPITINNGYEMRAWYDITALSASGMADKVGIERAVKLTETLIENEINRGIAPENIVLAGFSQGAVIALITGLGYPKRLGGMIALSGYLPLANEILARASEANLTIPIFMAHGTEDSIVPYALGKAAYVTLKQADYAATWHTYPMPHSVCAEEVQDLSLWMQKVMV